MDSETTSTTTDTPVIDASTLTPLAAPPAPVAPPPAVDVEPAQALTVVEKAEKLFGEAKTAVENALAHFRTFVEHDVELVKNAEANFLSAFAHLKASV